MFPVVVGTGGSIPTRRQIHRAVMRVDRVVAALGVAVGDELAGRLVGEAVRAR